MKDTLATARDCAKPPRRLIATSAHYWRDFTARGIAAGTLKKADLPALALCCAALGLLDAEPTMERLAEARLWLHECRLTPLTRTVS